MPKLSNASLLEERIKFEEASLDEQIRFADEARRVAVSKLKFAEHYAKRENLDVELLETGEKIEKLLAWRECIRFYHKWSGMMQETWAEEALSREAEHKELLRQRAQARIQRELDKQGRRGQLERCGCGTGMVGNRPCPKCGGRKWIKPGRAAGESRTDLTKRFGLDDPQVASAMKAAGIDPVEWLKKMQGSN